MTQIWFLPIAILIGIFGTRTGLYQHRVARKVHRDRSWWLIVTLAWLPAVCWALAQFVRQD